MKNATYWIVKPGQIQPGEVLDTGHRTSRDAWKALGMREGRVACLATVEHELPADNPACEPFESMRYCVLVRS